MARGFEHPPGDAGGRQLITLAGYLSANEAVKAARHTLAGRERGQRQSWLAEWQLLDALTAALPGPVCLLRYEVRSQVSLPRPVALARRGEHIAVSILHCPASRLALLRRLLRQRFGTSLQQGAHRLDQVLQHQGLLPLHAAARRNERQGTNA